MRNLQDPTPFVCAPRPSSCAGGQTQRYRYGGRSPCARPFARPVQYKQTNRWTARAGGQAVAAEKPADFCCHPLAVPSGAKKEGRGYRTHCLHQPLATAPGQHTQWMAVSCVRACEREDVRAGTWVWWCVRGVWGRGATTSEDLFLRPFPPQPISMHISRLIIASTTDNRIDG